MTSTQSPGPPGVRGDGLGPAAPGPGAWNIPADPFPIQYPDPSPQNSSNRRRIGQAGAALAGLLSYVLVTYLLGGGFFGLGAEDDDWTTVSESGMSMELPASFTVHTDSDEAADAMSGAEGPNIQENSDFIRQFPDMFVLLAYGERNEDVGQDLVFTVTRVPSGGATIDEVFDGVLPMYEAEGLEATRGRVGIGEEPYAAVTLNYTHPEFPPGTQGTDYWVVDGSVLWVIETLFADGDEAHAEISAKAIDSLVLP